MSTSPDRKGGEGNSVLEALTEHFERDVRGQSEAVGVVLVLGMVVLGALAVAGLGAVAISDTESQISEDRAEKTLTQFDSKAGLVALREADSQQVGFPTESGENVRVDGDEGRLWIEIENRTTNSIPSWADPLVDVNLGAVIYESNDETLAYQGGGVFKTDGDNSTMVSPPEFHYRNATLTLPIVNVTGHDTLGSRATISHRDVNQTFPRPDVAKRTNPLDNHKVVLKVESEYYEGWGQYFEARTEGDVDFDHGNNTVTLELVVPAEYPTVTQAVLSGNSGTLEVDNMDIFSYNSTGGTSCPPSPTAVSCDDEGKIVTAGDMELHPNADVHGDVEVGGELTLQGSGGTIYNGNISTGEGSAISSNSGDCFPSSNWHCTPGVHWEAENANVQIPDPTDRLIENQLESLSDSANNDNDQEDDIDETTNSLSCSGMCDIDSGKYYLEDTFATNDVTLNTTEGDISIAIDGDLTLSDIDFDVEGDNRVNIYVNETLLMERHAEIGDTSSYRAPQFWIYMKSDESATIENQVEYVGVVYGPGRNVDEGVEIDFNSGNPEIWGALLGNIDSLDNTADIYFDAALLNTETVTEESSVVRITFIHVTENEINVD